jgi:hypothetical protein
VLHHAADPGGRDVEHARGAADRSGDHDGADHFDLPQRQHRPIKSDCIVQA